MSLTQGGQQLPQPTVLSQFQPDITQMTNFANSLWGQQVAPGAFTPSPGTTSAAGVGNNYFGPGGTGTLGNMQLGNILSGNNLNPSTNPYLQDNISTMQQAFNQTLGQNTDALNAQFAQSGQTGNSGARDNAFTQLDTNAFKNFGNSLTDFLGGNYEQGQGQITSALGDLNAPLTAASSAGTLGQAPGQLEYQGQLAQNDLSSIPFNLLSQIMQNAPVAGPSFAPSSPSDLGSWLNLAASFGNSASQMFHPGGG